MMWKEKTIVDGINERSCVLYNDGQSLSLLNDLLTKLDIVEHQ